MCCHRALPMNMRSKDRFFSYDYFFKRKIILFLKARVVCVRSIRVYCGCSIFLQVYRRDHICVQLVRKIIVYYSTIELNLIAPSALVAQINQLNSITYIDTKSKFIQFLSPLISTTIFIYVIFIIIFNHQLTLHVNMMH